VNGGLTQSGKSLPSENQPESQAVDTCWGNRWKFVWNMGLDLLFPPVCLCCLQEFPASTVAAKLCQDCDEALQADSSTKCPRCGQLVGAQALPTGSCAGCCNSGSPIDQVYVHGNYDGPLREVIIRMKRDRYEILTREMARLFARSLASQWEGAPPDVVAAVPVHWLRRMTRCTHVAASLARTAGDQLEVPPTIDLLLCTRRMGKQAWMLPDARRRNVRGGFAVSSTTSVQGKHVLVVDDVMTTGATLHEIARMLKQKRARRVTVAVLARGLSDTIGTGSLRR